ncbi:hypothetical protein TNCV_3391801 [Trichonephila clavipes]|nr:hypothetical protein TNCV_3391801 [Trichonephila clavipes]
MLTYTSEFLSAGTKIKGSRPYRKKHPSSRRCHHQTLHRAQSSRNKLSPNLYSVPPQVGSVGKGRECNNPLEKVVPTCF